MILRAGSASDIDGVMAVMTCAFDPAFGEAWNRAQCLGMLSLADVWLDLALDDEGRTVGFALSRMLVGEAELLLLAVGPAVRGGGIGAALIDRATAAARARGGARLLLEMRQGNRAEGLYRRIGFGEIGRRRGYYRGPGGALFDALTLARPIA